MVITNSEEDVWTYTWGDSTFSTSRAYKTLMGDRGTRYTPCLFMDLELQMSNEAQGILLALTQGSIKH
jgi:hypothetical protein